MKSLKNVRDFIHTLAISDLCFSNYNFRPLVLGMRGPHMGPMGPMGPMMMGAPRPLMGGPHRMTAPK